MSKQLLGLLLLGVWIWIGNGDVAHANVTIGEDPITIGNVTIGVPADGSSILSASPDQLVKIVLTTGCSEFTLITASPITVGNGGGGASTKTVTLRLTATTAGAKDCRVEVRDNGDNNLELVFHVTATAIASPVITLNPTPTFPDTEVGATSTGQLLRATNTGTGPLIITNASFSAGAGDYQLLLGMTAVTLQAGEHTDWSIACKPSTFGTRTGTFRIASNAANAVAGNTDFALTCIGRQGVAASATSTLPFGQVIQGVTKPLTLTLRNDGNSTINNIAGTLSDPNKGYSVTLPQTSLNGSATMVVTVNFAPQNGTHGGPVTLTLGGTWGANNTPTSIEVGLDGDGLGVSFSAAPSVDFSNFRFDARPTRTYSIRNTGEIALAITTSTFTPDSATTTNELGFVIRRNGATVNLPQTLGLSGGATDQLDVTVTAQPTARIGSVGGSVVLTSTTAPGVAQTLIITGNATAAAVSATVVVDFGSVDIDGGPVNDMATITNTGTAVLDIPSFMKQNVNGAFTINSPTSLTLVPMGTSLTIPVGYDPSVERAAPNIDDGVLVANLAGVIGPTMIMMRVQGRGIDRHINVMPGTEDAVAFPNQTNTPPITVTVNNSGEAMLHIRTVKVEPASEWKIVDGGPSGTNEILVNGGTEHAFKLEFTPTAQGEEIAGELILETDDNGIGNGSTTGIVRIPLKGVSLFVDARGGGGCNTSGAGGGGGLIVGAAALLMLRRRGRRSTASGSRTTATMLTLVALLVFAPAARGEGVELAIFAPTPATVSAGFQVQSPDVGASGNWVASSTLSYASEPLLLETKFPSGDVADKQEVASSASLQLGAAYAFLDRFEIGAHLPIYMQSGKSSNASAPPADGSALGNLSVHAKARLWRGGGLALGASAAVAIPTATKEQLTGSDQVEGRIQLLGSFTPAAMRKLTITVNAGPVLRQKSSAVSIAQQSGVAWGVGGSFRLLENLWATAEMFGVNTPSGKLPRETRDETKMEPATMLSQVEWLAGLSFKAERRFTIGVAAGRGVTDAVGAPSLRGVLSLSYVPGASASSSIRTVEPPKAPIDSDGDGLLDSADKCPSEAEDKDLFDDDDGCPEADNDKDGVADAQDKCPLDAEDKDGFQDDDGCPERDNDNDGVADAKDKCPAEAEDKDGFEDLDGCPEADNDRDGIADAQDKCPNEPETINAIKDDDGCPDKGDSTIAISPDRIETLDPIVFTGVKVARPSLNVLAQVGATLRARTEIMRVRITVHVQPSNDHDGDQAKSDKRAQAIRDWLIQQFAIAPGRLEVRGFGGTKPLVPPDSRGAARINDRVELIILERK
jgi:outer membrane protein OmpA-like peptidoglycan-associated protein